MSVCAVGSRSYEILRVPDDVDGRGRPGESQRHLELDRDRAAHVDVFRIGREALGGDRHVVGIGRKITEDEPPARIGRRGPPQSRQRVAQLDDDGGHDATSWILHRSLNGAGAAELLTPSTLARARQAP